MQKLRFIFIFFAVILFIILFYNLLFWNKIYPGISVNHIDIGGKTVTQASKLLSQQTSLPETIVLTSPDQEFKILLSDVDFKYDFWASANKALLFNRSGNIFYDSWQKNRNLFIKTDLGLDFSVDEQKLVSNLEIISDQISEKSQSPTVAWTGNQIEVYPGRLGKEVDTINLRIIISQYLAFNQNGQIIIPFEQTGAVLNPDQIQTLKLRAEKLIGKSLTLKYDTGEINLDFSRLVKTLSPTGENLTELVNIATDIADKINRQPKDSIFIFSDNHVSEFIPSQNGIKVKQESLQNMLIGNIRQLGESEIKNITLEIPVIITEPKIQTKDANNLGIKELLGSGASRFAHSIENRIYNIRLASSKFEGVLIPPGEVFSFNDILGDVSSLTGYKQAFIIKDGKTILGDGGGVCQVSSTLFRAALNSGLPIVERKAHAYRVGYYEQGSPPGLDATVYAPLADLKFKNDTSAYILIQSIYDAKNLSLVFDIYGTNDGRQVTVSKPTISNQTPPPETVYQDDPSLPAGQTKQIEYAAWGAKVEFNYLVTLKGATLSQQKFVSYYRPWQAVYLRGTGI